MAESLELIVRNGTLVSGDGRRAADVAVAHGRVVAIASPRQLASIDGEEIDARGLFVLPGLIDSHVHFRSPGLEQAEDWQTGTRAALMGGVTTVLDMPNTLPPTDSAEAADDKLRLADLTADCDFGLFGLLGRQTDRDLDGLLANRSVVGLKAFLGSTTGDLAVPDDEGVLRGLAAARRHGVRVAFHAEDEIAIRAAQQRLRRAGRTDPLAHAEARPPEAEVRAIERAAALLARGAAKGHVCHVSTVDGLAAVEAWRARGVDLTCEVTPHHLLLTTLDLERAGSLAKMNPPLRPPGVGDQLFDALAGSRIDMIASDHAPHTAEDKRGDIWTAAAGMPGVETMLPLLLTAVADGRLALERLVTATAEAPARAWGLWPAKGGVAVGSDADLTLVDLDREGVIRAGALHGRNNATPFEGWPTRGAAVATIVRGRVVARDGELVGERGWGRPVSRDQSGV
jgi:dihydroorotase